MRLAAIVLGALLAGCAILRPDSGEALQVREVVDTAVGAAGSTQEEQGRRMARAQQAYAAVSSDTNRLKLAVLLSTLAPPLRDEAKAAALLEPVATRQPETPLAQLARLLAASIAERQRMNLELRAAELRTRAAELRAQAADLRAEAAERREAAATERADTLNRQVEALKSIERGILDREERRRTNKR